jgi:hypothetical protein
MLATNEYRRPFLSILIVTIVVYWPRVTVQHQDTTRDPVPWLPARGRPCPMTAGHLITD